MQDAGSEKTPTKASTDGRKDLSVSLKIDNAATGKGLSAIKSEEEMVNYLQNVGINRKVARRILRMSGLDDFLLDRRVVAGVVATDWMSNMERLGRLQSKLTSFVCRTRKKPRKSTENDGEPAQEGQKDDPMMLKIMAANSCAALSTAMARIGEQLIHAAPTSDDEGNRKKMRDINFNFNMPPVAKPNRDAGPGASDIDV